MGTEAIKILEKALALPADDKAHIADCLLESIEVDSGSDVELPADVEAACVGEAQRRAAELASGEVVGRPWSEVVAGLQSRLRRQPGHQE